MEFLPTILLAIGVSMDAFIVSICKGAALKKVAIAEALIVAGWLGAFHFLMPLLGGYAGTAIHGFIASIDHWVVLVVLGYLGCKMMYDAVTESEERPITSSISWRTMLFLAFVVSLDALAVGVSVLSRTEVFLTAFTVGLTTFVLCIIGTKIGSVFGNIFGRKMLFLGGFILVSVGVMAVLEAYGIVHMFRTGMRQKKGRGPSAGPFLRHPPPP